MTPSTDTTGRAQPGAVLVLGAGPGVGLAVARRFADDGHPVALVARDRERLSATVRDLEADGRRAAYALADVRDPDAVAAAVGDLQRRLGPVEVLCVSPLPDVATIKPAVDTTAQDLGAALALGVVGPAAAVSAVLPAMREAGRGTLLFTTGSAVLTPRPERAASGIVNAAQATWFGMLHDQLAPEGVHVLHTVIVGPIGEGGHAPADLAAAMWASAREGTDAQLVIR
ncbi:SDR family oxidoreductase [Conexibacter sp. SYSU D00693]|uniref:SDR family NAD(P)-dependent oxidoreductase n=1 Tax=Conexibacter sp. SYSU D00693 TaxID=2812560 RepID=UPI00196B98F4|nr:SDR family NAD(P)-dependent oxidoreductase [Conexibacter sp. SYSU D00693]